MGGLVPQVASLAQVVLPVFLVIGFGYLAARLALFPASGVDGLVTFTQNFAIPCLLFRELSRLDLSAGFDAALLGAFYVGAVSSFALTLLGARLIFARPWEDSVAIGFCALFSNSVLLGLPIMERAFGPASLAGNFAIIALHAPVCYAVGITVMEVTRGRGASPGALARKVGRAMFHNALILGIMAGLAVNLAGIPQPAILAEALDLMVRAALPAALFGLGGVLARYRPEGDVGPVAMVCLASLVLHPGLVWGLGRAFELPEAAFRSAVVTAAMAPGVNTYIFANLYGVGRRVAATAVLAATGLSLLTAAGWIWALGAP